MDNLKPAAASSNSTSLMALVTFLSFFLMCSAPIVSGVETRKLDETVPGTEKCTPCAQAPPPPPPPAPCPPPPALPPPPPPPPALPPPSPKKPPSKYCPPPPPSSYIYITGPPGSLYPIDQNFNGASRSLMTRLEFVFLIGFGLLALLGHW